MRFLWRRRHRQLNTSLAALALEVQAWQSTEGHVNNGSEADRSSRSRRRGPRWSSRPREGPARARRLRSQRRAGRSRAESMGPRSVPIPRRRRYTRPPVARNQRSGRDSPRRPTRSDRPGRGSAGRADRCRRRCPRRGGDRHLTASASRSAGSRSVAPISRQRSSGTARSPTGSPTSWGTRPVAAAKDIPARYPLTEISGVLKSPCASSQMIDRFPRPRCTPARIPTDVRQSPASTSGRSARAVWSATAPYRAVSRPSSVCA